MGSEGESWTYKSTGTTLAGPAQWSSQYPACAGTRQSPIDITSELVKTVKQTTEPIQFSGNCPTFTFKQHWDSFKAEPVNSTCSMVVQGTAHAFAQVHFHAPSEHTVNGVAYDAEAHFVHQSSNGSLAVVGVFLQKKKNAQSDAYFSKFLSQLKSVTATSSPTATL